MGFLDWLVVGGYLLVMVGIGFATAARSVRGHAARIDPASTVVVAGYSNGCPGYLPSADEYSYGGYEVQEAHRFYGMPGPFARGSAERLVREAAALIG